MNNKTLLVLVVALASAFVSTAYADPAHAPHRAAAAASAPSKGPVADAGTPASPRATPLPRLELQLPSAPGVVCACVRSAPRA